MDCGNGLEERHVAPRMVGMYFSVQVRTENRVSTVRVQLPYSRILIIAVEAEEVI